MEKILTEVDRCVVKVCAVRQHKRTAGFVTMNLQLALTDRLSASVPIFYHGFPLEATADGLGSEKTGRGKWKHHL
jgi:hypothetical protein